MGGAPTCKAGGGGRRESQRCGALSADHARHTRGLRGGFCARAGHKCLGARPAKLHAGACSFHDTPTAVSAAPSSLAHFVDGNGGNRPPRGQRAGPTPGPTRAHAGEEAGEQHEGLHHAKVWVGIAGEANTTLNRAALRRRSTQLRRPCPAPQRAPFAHPRTHRHTREGGRGGARSGGVGRAGTVQDRRSGFHRWRRPRGQQGPHAHCSCLQQAQALPCSACAPPGAFGLRSERGRASRPPPAGAAGGRPPSSWV